MGHLPKFVVRSRPPGGHDNAEVRPCNRVVLMSDEGAAGRLFAVTARRRSSPHFDRHNYVRFAIAGLDR